MTKKTIFTLLILIVPVFLTACGETTDNLKTIDSSTSSAQEKKVEKKVEKQVETKKAETTTEINKQVNKNTMKYKPQAEQDDLLKEFNTAILNTNLGNIEIKFYENSPVTVNNFLNLAKAGYYDGTKFHRVISNFMIQGGDILSRNPNSMENRWGTGGPGYAIEDEFIEGLSNTPGTIAMANSGPNSGGSQFFINLINNDRLDWDKGSPSSKHPVFGEIVDGMDVVTAIGVVKTATGDMPVEPVIINSIELLKK